MWEQTQLIIQTIQLAAVLAILVLRSITFAEYFRLKRRTTRVISLLRTKMDCDDLIDQLLEDAPASAAPAATNTTPLPQRQEQKRTRLAAIVAGGTAQKYIGNRLTLAQIDEMGDDEISKHYGRYEARLGASMTKTLGASALQMYALVAGNLLPIPPENHALLVADLEEDPFVEHALTTACCELYYRYGMYLAPLTAAMTTAKHCQFGDQGSLANISTDNAPSVDIEHGEVDGCRAIVHSSAAGQSRQSDSASTGDGNNARQPTGQEGDES